MTLRDPKLTFPKAEVDSLEVNPRLLMVKSVLLRVAGAKGRFPAMVQEISNGARERKDQESAGQFEIVGGGMQEP